ncbi:MAG: hypothetical protein SGI74_07810 [Oligoflexia bacterium]|nr:hypothetical protein [Oligoflexia bacterium]
MKIFNSFPYILPYLVSGFAAPIIFKSLESKHRAGIFAGALFIMAGVWALFLSIRHDFPKYTRIYFSSFLGLQILFWTWRFFQILPLNESFLLGINGSHWHGVLTTLYLVGILLIVYSEYSTDSI